MRLKLYFVLAFLLSVSLVSAQSSTMGWKLVDVQSLTELTGTANVRYEALSADGSALVWVNVGDHQLCIYRFASSEQNCLPYPENYTGFNKYSSLSWSPDGKTLVFTEDPFMLVLDSDIWTYDVSTGTAEDRTDDGFFGSFITHPESQPNLDYLPSWNPANGDLYFFRSVRSQSSTSLVLELMPLTRKEPKQVFDFSLDFPTLSVYRPPAISPNGERMAVIVLGQKPDDPQNGIWVAGLKDGSLAQVMKMSDFKRGLPDWAAEKSQLYPEYVQWAGDNALIVSARDAQGFGTGIQQNAFYLDLSAQTITPLADFADVADSPSFFQDSGDLTQPIYRMPRAGVATPDGKTYLYISFGLTPNKAYVWSLNLPPDGSKPQQIGEIDPMKIMPAADAQPAVAPDGKHALLFGYWLTFEPPA